ncbi:MAG: flagellar export protein FliJ [Steroidobacteraceae bacterium]
MKRADRLVPVQKVVDDTERRMAEHFASAERLLMSSEQKLVELTSYRDDYTQGFARRASGGIGARDLVDYQAFMTRLNDAIAQQDKLVCLARGEAEAQRKHWQEAAQRAKAIATVIENWQQEERRVLGQREQRETDERAQRRRVTSQRQ